jgi:hypothetical protein
MKFAIDRCNKANASCRVSIGYTSAGRNRWRYFATLETARAFCVTVFERTGIVLSIRAVTP